MRGKGGDEPHKVVFSVETPISIVSLKNVSPKVTEFGSKNT